MPNIGKHFQTALLSILCGVIAFGTARPTDAAVTVTYYHADAVGSPVAATDDAGQLLWTEDYLPYGEQTVFQTTDDNEIYYTGKPHDADTGLTYFGARHYDPVVGRFMGIDPVGVIEDNVHSFNRYAYANNNPYRYIDPDGEAAIAAARYSYAIARVTVTPAINYGVRVFSAGMFLSLGDALFGVLNESSESGSDEGRRIGDIVIPGDATPDDARGILDAAGSPSIGSAQDGEFGTEESGTVHEVDINGQKVKVRVMDGRGRNGPRISVNSGANPKQPVDPTTGRPFKGNPGKQKQKELSHIPLSGPKI